MRSPANTNHLTEAPQLLKPAEVAHLLRRSRQAIYDGIKRGSIPAVRLDEHGPLLIPRRALEARLFGKEHVMSKIGDNTHRPSQSRHGHSRRLHRRTSRP